MSTHTATDDKMINAPVWGQFVRFSVPSVLGMLAISSAAIVDGLIVGNFVGAEALAAVTIVMPLFSLLIGLTIMLSVGAAVMAGKMLGEANADAASGVLGKTSVVMLAMISVLTLVALLAPELMVQAMGAQGDLVPLSALYLWALAWSFPFLGLAILLMQFLRIDGQPGYSLAAMVSITVVNIVLDIWLVVYADMGLAGAAWATGISYMVGALIALYAFVIKGSHLRFSLGQDSWLLVYRAALNGSSEFLNEASAGLVMLIFNWVLMTQVGSIGVASFAIVNYLLMVGLMVFYGIAEGLGALFSVNLGAQKADRIALLLHYGVMTCLVIGVMFALLIWFKADVLVGVFADGEDVETIALAVSIATIIWPVFLFNGANLIISGYFTGMQKPGLSATLAVLRSLALPVVFILTFFTLFGLGGIFYALPVAEVVTLCVALVMLKNYRPAALVSRS